MVDLTYALAEEIGDPELFVGRRSEMARLLKWADGTKRRLSKSDHRRRQAGRLRDAALRTLSGVER
ncbi:MAG: hypothetical protein GY769_23335 [bacterium]|nr:hypothetical protein [bacterium]